ncbi:hypothetical protein ACHAPT_011085 [Fusarium lateritium]
MFGTCSPSKFDYVRSLGVIPLDRHSSDIADQVKALTNGEGVDVAYDPVGSAESLRASHLATKQGIGNLISTGVMDEISEDGSGLKKRDGDFLPSAIAESRKQPRMTFWAVYSDYYLPDKESFIADFHSILEKVRNGQLDPVIAKKFPLSDSVQAHQELISGASVKGRMVYIVDKQLALEHGL